ncbi:MAG TPA: beta-ketoacyl synthase N-terminal-like domain-containing protein [Thermoplasmata archaeon]|nr:beta-ketoacyl synthase N-terminal-like domain-containing protein [Thermoplasmata archaeon]
MRKVAIVGCGLTKWGVRAATYKELAQEVSHSLFADIRDLDRGEVDSLIVGSALVDRLAFQAYPAPVVAEQMGLTPTRMCMRTEMACVSGQAAIRAAYTSIASGLSDIAIVVGIEKMNLPNLAETQASMACVLDREWDGVNGLNAPPYFALVAQRHMHEYGTTREQMGLVKVKNAEYGATNPTAHFPKAVSLEKVLASPMIAPPLRLLDCSGITDGAAAVVMTHGDLARRFTDTPVFIEGLGQATDGSLVVNLKSLTTWYPLRAAARDALKMAGVGVGDMDLAEVHDCFTISEIIEYEDLGLCPKGQGGKFIEDGQSRIGGTLPVNLRGGLLACGHPLGATGVAQAIEVVQQFKAQVPKERHVGGEWGLCHNLSGSANNHAVMVLHRGG